MADKTIQLGIPIDPELNEKVNKLATRGTKAEAVRALLKLLIETQAQRISDGHRDFVVDHLLRGRCKLVVIEHDKTTV